MLKCNRFSPNYAKTPYIVYTPKRNSIISEKICIQLGNYDIPFMDALKCVGVVIDKQMNWNAHIDYTVKKLSYAARIFSIVRHYVNKKTLTKLYYSFAYPHIEYGIVSWGSACQTYLEKIQVMQNNIICIMNFKFVKDRVDMSLLYKSMKILKLNDIYELEIAKFMHSYYHCKLPENFVNYFKNTILDRL